MKKPASRFQLLGSSFQSEKARTLYLAPKTCSRGYFVILVLVYSAVFLALISALAGYIFVEKRAQLAKENREKAFHIAEAGLEYYRWHLAHFPDDLQNGTGGPGPYEKMVPDPEGGALGTFSLDISGEMFCGAISSVVITSTGWAAADPAYKRVLTARYTRPSVAEFSHIVDANVWAGSDRIISGPYHSNNGVRMDGTHNATVSSGVTSWSCTGSFGCSPTQTVDGVFGSGSNPELWNFPVPPVDFNGLTVNLVQLKGFATTSGVYLPPSGNYGYRVIFRDNGTIETRRVTGATQVWEYSTDAGWQQVRRVVANTSAATIYTVPADCPVVFVEDDTWLSGEVTGKVIIAAANVTTPGTDRSITLEGNLTYDDSESGITAIGEADILIGLDTPNTMDIFGIFIAQNGHFGRNHYDTAYLPSNLDQYVTRSTLNTTGTVVSRGRVGTKWSSGGTFVSGYSQRNDSYDRDLADAPPPFTPWTSSDYTFRSWEEVN